MPRKPAQPVDKKARFAKLMGRYKTYDPKVEGYGSVSQWRESWEQTMGIDEAKETLGEDSPYTIMGVSLSCTKAELKIAYRKLILKNQACFLADATPEQQEQAKRIIAAYSVLDEKLTG